MDELLNDFLIETAEHIEAAGLQLVLFERDPTDLSIISSIFRLIHTIKGTCGFLGLPRLEHLAHAAEALIGSLRDGAAATPEIVSLVLAAVDRVKFILAELENSAKEPVGDDTELVRALQAQLVETEVYEQRMDSPPALRPAEETVHAASDASAEAIEPSHATAQRRRPDTIRVAVGTLERIMILVSELVLTRNQLLELTRHQEDETVKAPLQRLSALTSDLQDAVMRARMEPVERLFSRLPRLVRELSVELKKKISLVTDGGETELDRQLIELIRDPLTHILRNCADHGIEPPELRLAQGKPESGTIQVTASHEAGYITIDVVDDGRGLDIEKIRAKAVTNELITQAEASRLSDEEVCRFILAPNFSTANAITNISGRGVGMDVVRNNIESIGGSISLTTSAGRGTRFSMKIPLTLAIAPALIVEVGAHRFALPQHSVIEAIGLDADSSHAIEHVHGSLILRLRDEVLPVADLRPTLGLASDPNDRSSANLAVVMRVGALAFGILVDSVSDVQEIVVKPLGPSLAQLDMFSGHTILGDGSVVLILDPSGIASNLGLEQASDYSVGRTVETYVPTAESTRLVLFRAGGGALKAVPLSLIGRIESVAQSAIEVSDGAFVMRHQGHLMPLVKVAIADTDTTRSEHPVLVLSVGGESMGLIVDEIVDIVEQTLEIQIAGASPGILGSAQIRDNVVEILDVTHFMRLARPNAFARGFAKRFNVLLVDDKQFFRDMLSPVLTAVGYRVTTAESGADALALFQRGAHFDAVVTDTDMPGMNGYELSRALMEDPRRSNLPILALAAHAAPAVVQAAAASGMRGAVGKFDRVALLCELGKVLDPHELNSHEVELRIIGDMAA